MRAARLVPLALQEDSIVVGPGLDTHQDSPGLDALLVVLDAHFRDSGPDQCADESARNATRTRTGCTSDTNQQETEQQPT